MLSSIAIDPNVRIEGGLTYAGFEDVMGLPIPLHEGDLVRVEEPESRFQGAAVVRKIDPTTEIIELEVDWRTFGPAPETSARQVAISARWREPSHRHQGHDVEVLTHPVLVTL